MCKNKKTHEDKTGKTVYIEGELSNMEMRKENLTTQNTYKKASMTDVIASMKKCTKQYDKALKNLAK